MIIGTPVQYSREFLRRIGAEKGGILFHEHGVTCTLPDNDGYVYVLWIGYKLPVRIPIKNLEEIKP